MGENLQDHLILGTQNVSKTPLAESDFCGGSIHGMTYISVSPPTSPPPPPPPPPGASSCPPGVSSPPDGAAASKAAMAAAGAPALASSIPETAETKSAAAAVFGLMPSDGDELARNLDLYLGMLFFMWPGLLGAVARAVARAVCWAAGLVPPVRRALRNTRGILMAVTTIKSKGTVRLASGEDASAPPLIDPAYFSHPDDRRAACEGWRKVRRAKRETAAGKAFFGLEIAPGKRLDLFCQGRPSTSCLSVTVKSNSGFVHLDLFVFAFTPKATETHAPRPEREKGTKKATIVTHAAPSTPSLRTLKGQDAHRPTRPANMPYLIPPDRRSLVAGRPSKNLGTS